MKSLTEHIATSDEQILENFINEGGILSIIKSMGSGDLVEIVSAITATDDFVKSSAKREIIDQLNKRGYLPDSISKIANTYQKYKPLAKKIF